MNKKLIGIVIGLLVVVAIIIGLFVFKPWTSFFMEKICSALAAIVKMTGIMYTQVNGNVSFVKT